MKLGRAGGVIKSDEHYGKGSWFWPAADGDLVHGVVAMAKGHARRAGVVLALQEDAHMHGSHELLQGGAVVEVVVAWSQVRLWG